MRITNCPYRMIPKHDVLGTPASEKARKGKVMPVIVKSSIVPD